jgi:hypothetical protein
MSLILITTVLLVASLCRACSNQKVGSITNADRILAIVTITCLAFLLSSIMPVPAALAASWATVLVVLEAIAWAAWRIHPRAIG